MISHQPIIRVGIIDHQHQIVGEFNGGLIAGDRIVEGKFTAFIDGRSIVLVDENGLAIASGAEIHCIHSTRSTFTLHDVTIGIGFHWERKESETFGGDLILKFRDDGTIVAINAIPLELYLASVISSEMSAEASTELLKAHAITSRSWLAAMLEREKERNIGIPSQRTVEKEGELIRWYDREDHDLFDVCADDHCQRYQGITKILSDVATSAVSATKGMFIVHEGKICDARFSKSCGGRTERFESCWEDIQVPYLNSFSDSGASNPTILNEKDAQSWIHSRPSSYCNTADPVILKQILPSFDRETADFFRWKVEYRREELEELLRLKSGFDFGTLINLVPVQRGPSGRIVKLRIEGTKKTLTVGKELEIRRWLSKSHLYSSAFVVDTERGDMGVPTKFILHGAGGDMALACVRLARR